jgi:hypothetical protein
MDVREMEEDAVRLACRSQLQAMLQSEELLRRYLALVGNGEATEARRLMALIQRIRRRREAMLAAAGS